MCQGDNYTFTSTAGSPPRPKGDGQDVGAHAGRLQSAGTRRRSGQRRLTWGAARAAAALPTEPLSKRCVIGTRACPRLRQKEKRNIVLKTQRVLQKTIVKVLKNVRS